MMAIHSRNRGQRETRGQVVFGFGTYPFSSWNPSSRWVTVLATCKLLLARHILGDGMKSEMEQLSIPPPFSISLSGRIWPVKMLRKSASQKQKALPSPQIEWIMTRETAAISILFVIHVPIPPGTAKFSPKKVSGHFMWVAPGMIYHSPDIVDWAIEEAVFRGKNGLYVVARNFCLALPGSCLAKNRNKSFFPCTP